MKSTLVRLGLLKTSYPQIKNGFRGEGYVYELGNRRVNVSTTLDKVEKIYLDGISNWYESEQWYRGGPLTNEEKIKIFRDMVFFIHEQRGKRPIVVINIDRDKDFWESVCEQFRNRISGVEYTATTEKDSTEYNRYLSFIRTGLTLEGQVIKNQNDLDDYWRNKRVK
ncbi:MAG: hypothetical protein ACMVP2_19745 [Imperialibacter sp.]|uniref:hypothetical protein n=1 Tax=Imperialibacter sp. TaxID=2038411 RepID=UPI003A839853